ncbi:multisubunit sodium/proton antiporter, MrpD subunit [Cyanobacterium stanieri PCC 7202]|uniref:Multisubunit sodium/proton antiporter, MrpD subunit n=1 Tax=Cyanobacterium stanieri (strain ATCC 29140 / PCC 7202) TaxID=292563 RepID=K9YJX6_CYASC|nr:multisubunit sodium/proton antiporter, MrpD subunit [Cyanobacterium stanieri PCC 7202]
MTTFTVIAVFLPLFTGFSIYLVNKIDRIFCFFTVCFSAFYASYILINDINLPVQLLDNAGVQLLINNLSGYFILTNALVTGAVILYCWQIGKKTFFYTQLIVLHGSMNALFLSADFLSVYVALEVVAISAFLLVVYPRTDNTLWVGIRYLFISNIAMLFYLIGTILVYKSNQSFAFEGLINSPPEAIALIFLGLFTKGGVFVLGLWLPLTQSESESSVSAILAGVVEKAGIFPLLRCTMMMDEFNTLIHIVGVATAFFGVIYALFSQDTKRILASSTVSQFGWILVAPEVGGYYALAHGLAKANLFMAVGALPSRSIRQLQDRVMSTRLWLTLLVGSLSICGFPLFFGFAAKTLVLNSLSPTEELFMNISAVGTAMIYAKFIFLPSHGVDRVKSHIWWGVIPLMTIIFVANFLYFPAYTPLNVAKALGLNAIGFLLHFLIFKKVVFTLSRYFEELEQIMGIMILMLVVLFWMVISWSPVSFFA